MDQTAPKPSAATPFFFDAAAERVALTAIFRKHGFSVR